jgi:DNA-directed RNA polymerase subunit RPC12/RpoP|tara:strand:- start:88 stop:324 length:237 start_codon:yes stop_codon:yes gene_type:complete
MSKTINMPDDNAGRSMGLKLEDMTDIVCENCGCRYFNQVHAFKRVSALLSPTGKEQIAPVPSFRCSDCGHINEEFLIK